MEQEEQEKEENDKEEEGETQEGESNEKQGKKTKSHILTTVLHPAAGHVADFCISQVHATTETNNIKTRLHLLVLLRQVIHTFPRKKVKVRE